jgi:hypothetical protein
MRRRVLGPRLEAADGDHAPVLVLVLAHGPPVVVHVVEIQLLAGSDGWVCQR